MKIRTGFVSNSSSSSFLCLAKRVDKDILTKEDLKNGNYFINTNVLGSYAICASHFTEDMYDYFEPYFDDVDIYKIYKETYDEELDISKEDIGDEKLKVLALEVDQNFNEDYILKQLENRNT